MSEVGIIGQMYENRKSKKIGVLESRDEKFKTLLFRGDDGSSFNVNYSTFKSNWRKYEGDKLIQTSSQVEDAKEEAAAEAASVKKVVEKSRRTSKKITDKALHAKVVHMFAEKLKEFAADNVLVKVGTKGWIGAYFNRHKYLEFWLYPEDDSFSVHFDNAFFEAYEFEYGIKETAVAEPQWNKYGVRELSYDKLEEIAKYLIGTLNAYAEENSESSENSDTAEEE